MVRYSLVCFELKEIEIGELITEEGESWGYCIDGIRSMDCCQVNTLSEGCFGLPHLMDGEWDCDGAFMRTQNIDQ